MFPEQKADLVLEELLERLRPRLRRTFARHRIPPLAAERMLCDLLTAMVLRWPEVEDPARWMTVTLCQRCQVYRRRQQQLATLARASSRTGREDDTSSLPGRSADADGNAPGGTKEVAAGGGPPGAGRQRGPRERVIAILRCGLGIAAHADGAGPRAVARLLEELEREPQARGRAIRTARHRP